MLVWLLKGEELLAGALGHWDIGDWLPAALGEGLVRPAPAPWPAGPPPSP